MENETVNSRDKNGKFVSGHHIGRPKGSGNKKLNVVKEKFQQLLDGYPVQQMQADLMEMKPGERLRLIVDMADFFMPKLNRVDNSLSIGSDTIIILPLVPSTTAQEIPPATLEVPLYKDDDNRPVESEDIQSDLPAAAE